MAAVKPTTTPNKRSNKPIMEKRRRARINSCLDELKSLILDSNKKDQMPHHSKLEKADILRMTVQHLQTLQAQQVLLAAVTDPYVMGNYRAGFTQCAQEVSRFVNGFPGIEPAVSQRLISHLSSCMQGLQNSNNSLATPQFILTRPHALPERPKSGSVTTPSSPSSSTYSSPSSPDPECSFNSQPNSYSPMHHGTLPESPRGDNEIVLNLSRDVAGFDPSCWRPW